MCLVVTRKCSRHHLIPLSTEGRSRVAASFAPLLDLAPSADNLASHSFSLHFMPQHAHHSAYRFFPGTSSNALVHSCSMIRHSTSSPFRDSYPVFSEPYTAKSKVSRPMENCFNHWKRFMKSKLKRALLNEAFGHIMNSIEKRIIADASHLTNCIAKGHFIDMRKDVSLLFDRSKHKKRRSTLLTGLGV